MTVCVFAEDSRRKSGKAYQVLAKKIVGRQGTSLKSLPRGELLNVAKLKVHLSNLKNPGKISKAVICIDSHSDPDGMATAVASVQTALASSVRFPVKYVVVVHALETWLLQDPKAIQKVLGVRVNSQKLHEMAKSCQPDRALGRVCDSFDKSIDDERIALEADIDVIAKKNSSFREFVAALRNP